MNCWWWHCWLTVSVFYQVTELIYIHSKLMIVDDNTVILGSANINDRSMLGKRDSELAIVVRDKNREKVFKNNHILQPGHFASGLRRYLFHEHMGLAGHEMDISDISTDEFFHDVWRNRAARNTDVFERVFLHYFHHVHLLTLCIVFA